MKKSFVLGLLGLTAVTASSFGDGYIYLDNYNNGLTGGPPVTYGIGIPANGVSGPLGAPNGGLNNSWTVGIYYAIGTLNIFDPAGNGMPNAALVLGTGTGSTAAFDSINTGNTPGEFASPQRFDVVGSGTPTITAELVAYPTVAGSYAAALYRAHSTPFTMPTGTLISPTSPMVGDYMPTFSIGTPEPSQIALSSLAGLSLWLLRRKQS